MVNTHNIQDLPPNLTQEDERGLESSRSILVTSGGELDSSDEEPGSHEHRKVLRTRHVVWHRRGDLDTVEEVTEPEDSEDNGLWDSRPRSI